MQRTRAGCIWWLVGSIIGVPLLVGGIILLLLGVAAFAYDEAPKEYADWVQKNLGVSSSYNLSEEDAERVKEVNLDPELVAIALSVSQWTENSLGVKVDPGIILSIMKHECGNGTFFGTRDAREAIKNNPRISFDYDNQKRAIDRLMEHFQIYQIRDWSMNAFIAVYPDYSSYKGADAAEAGAGFVPTSLERQCFGKLQHHDDYEVASCNVWEMKVSGFAIGGYLVDIGYNGTESSDELATTMLGWNQSSDWVNTLLQTRDLYNQKLFELGMIDVEYSPKYIGGWLKQAAVWLLDAAELMPEQEIIEANMRRKLPKVARGEGQVYIDLSKDVPEGQVHNVLVNAAKMKKIVFKPGKTWAFCATAVKNWAGYVDDANGICANASVMENLAVKTKGLTVIYSKDHAFFEAYPIFTTNIYCYSHNTVENPAYYDLLIKNDSEEDIVFEWGLLEDENILVLQVTSGPPVMPTPTLAPPVPYGQGE